MKKCFFGAIAVLALASCSNEKVVELSQDQAIKFTVEAGKATSRAADGYCNNHKPGEFNVWASAQGKNYFNALGENYTLQDGVYKPENGTLRYWPESGTVNFFATKNENGTLTWTYTNPSSLKFEGYTVQATPAAQKDFIYAAALNVAKPAADAADKDVKLNFRHALSQIEFKAQNNNDKIYVEIDEVSVVNVNSKGNITITKDTSTKFTDHNLGDAADDNDTRGDSRCEWSDQSDPTTYTASFTAVPVGSSATSLTVTDASGEYNTNTMYLLPQGLTAWNKSTAAKAEGQTGSYFLVKALIYNVAGSEVNKTNDVVVWGTKTGDTWGTKEIAIPVPASTTWEDGKRYVYTFVFTTDGNGGYDPNNNNPVLTPITLQVTVDDFVDAGNTNVLME